MRKSLLLCFTLLLIVAAHAQFNIGHTTLLLTDASRSNRSIPVEVYYPATETGDNTPWADGNFPVVVFGHGFFMSYSAYQNIWENQVPTGYVYAFLNTENGFTVSHNDFGLDFRFVSNNLNVQANLETSFFYQHISNFHVFMGHSMGGGAAFLAAQNFDDCKVLITLSAAETNPSAISAAANLTQPAVVIAASGDAVTPPATNQLLMFNAIEQCKYYVSITGGAHCYYANADFACDFGETTAGSQITISRVVQQTNTYNIITKSLNLFRSQSNSDQVIFDDFLNGLQTNSAIEFTKNCESPVNVANVSNRFDFQFYPNPSSGTLYFDENLTGNLTLSDLNGRIVFSHFVNNQTVTFPDLIKDGFYILQIEHQNKVITQKLIIKQN